MAKSDIVFIRGLGRGSSHWGGFVGLVEKQEFCNQVFTIDLPGNGKYFKLTSPLNIGEMAEFVMLKIRELNRDESVPLVIVAVSLGAMVAIEVGNRYGKKISKMVLINTSISNLSSIRKRLQWKAWKHIGKIITTKDLEKREREVLKMVSNRPENFDTVVKKWVEIAKATPVSPTNFFRQLLSASYYRLPKHRPEVPMLVINSKADRMVHFSCSEEIANQWNLPLVTHEMAGHELALDEPKWLIGVLQDHL